MASLIYNSFLNDLARGAINLDTDTFWVMLTTSGYSASKYTQQVIAQARRIGPSTVKGTDERIGGNITTTRRRIGKAPA